MKVELYNYIRAAQKMNRRQMLKGTAAVGAMAMMPKGAAMAAAHGSVRAEILKIPGVGAGSPTDSDWQKVGELCLGATKENVAAFEARRAELVRRADK